MLLMFAGPSTVGKDARWLSAAEKIGFTRVVPFTTRAKRPNEKVDQDYTFVSRPEFYQLVKAGKFLDWDYILDQYYGIPGDFTNDIDADRHFCLQIRATMGARIRQRFPDSRLIMLMTSDEHTLEARLRARGFDEAVVASRLKHGIEEMAQAPLCDLVVPDADILSEIDATRILQDYLSSR